MSILTLIKGNAGPTIIRWLAGGMGVRTSISVGSVLPVLSSATGQIFLSYLPRRQTAKLVKKELTDADETVEVVIARTRARGAAEASGRKAQIAGVSAIAMPVLDIQGAAATALTLIGPEGDVPSAVARTLREKCAAASNRLGYSR